MRRAWPLVVVAALALVRALTVERAAPAVAREVVVRPGLRSVEVAFTTAEALSATLAIAPSSPPVRLPAPEVPAREHALAVRGLSENTAYVLTLQLPGAAPLAIPFHTQALLIEHVHKSASLTRLTLSWTTNVSVTSSVVCATPGLSPVQRDVAETASLAHQAEVDGLTADRDYDVTILSRTEAGEISTSPPYRIKLFTTAANEALEQIQAAEVPRRTLAALWEYRHRNPDRARMQQLLRQGLDPVRPPLALVRAVSREFFSSPEVFVESKQKLYASLKMIEHLERVAAMRQLPLVPLLDGFDWGTWSQRDRSFDDARLPLPMPRGGPGSTGPAPRYLSDPSLLPDIAVDQQPATADGPRWLTETHAEREFTGAVEVFGRPDDGERELVYRFALADPSRIAAAELWLMYRQISPLQFFELEVNGRAHLILRPPPDLVATQWASTAVGLDPGLLVPGANTVRVTLHAIPEMLEGRRAFVWFAELRTRRQP